MMAKGLENSVAMILGALLVPALLWFLVDPAALLWPAMHWNLLLPIMAVLVITGISASNDAARKICRILVFAVLGLLVASFAVLFSMV
ncbi:hypothetical protein KUV51_19605 [Tateyamaria omphalii]|uniref:hypothetical protein n=1 Tax=Tateyamaria omphalii TaxID=299262 RepID=UPI001C99ACDA|nr:hypothetical protein [Tateyamaria omphalii]MBY5935222.1 hypothetical protein [Tateyamaria omphalii]